MVTLLFIKPNKNVNFFIQNPFVTPKGPWEAVNKAARCTGRLSPWGPIPLGAASLAPPLAGPPRSCSGTAHSSGHLHRSSLMLLPTPGTL